ncbi:metabotropic glutamate receptor-like, partial [Saccostrea cucullata]|uniref:metabotropic glutamate receptor-like n=1 Tax=Saccostrea cuccullata TaxID=36930 RepID=UPI002ED2ED86
MDWRVIPLVIVNVMLSSATLTPVISVSGDVYLAGIFTIKSSTFEHECNGPVSTSSVMGLGAVKWAVRRLNQNNFIPGVQLGLIAYPTCLSEELAGYRAVEISTAIKEKSENIMGIVGAERSSDSESMSTVLARLPRSIAPPMISYSSTSVSLSDKSTFPNFFRTIYSDKIQVKVIITLMLELHWNYISIVHENNAYGRHGAEALRTQLLNHGICIRTVNGFNTTYGVQISVLSQIISDVTLPKGGAVSGIVFFGGQSSAEKLLTAMKDINLGEDTPSIIFSEGVGMSKEVFKAETIAASRGNLVVSPKYQPVDSFLEHWKAIFTNKTLLLYEIQTNPWLKDVFL